MMKLLPQLYESKAFPITNYRKGGYPSFVASPRTPVAPYIVLFPESQLLVWISYHTLSPSWY
jgi:hypothetical protein